MEVLREKWVTPDMFEQVRYKKLILISGGSTPQATALLLIDELGLNLAATFYSPGITPIVAALNGDRTRGPIELYVPSSKVRTNLCLMVLFGVPCGRGASALVGELIKLFRRLSIMETCVVSEVDIAKLPTGSTQTPRVVMCADMREERPKAPHGLELEETTKPIGDKFACELYDKLVDVRMYVSQILAVGGPQFKQNPDLLLHALDEAFTFLTTNNPYSRARREEKEAQKAAELEKKFPNKQKKKDVIRSGW